MPHLALISEVPSIWSVDAHSEYTCACYVMAIVHVWSVNKPSPWIKKTGLDVMQSLPLHRTCFTKYQPISCAGVNERGRLLSQEPSQGAGLILTPGRTSVLEHCVSLCSCPLKIVATWQQSKSSHVVKWSMNHNKSMTRCYYKVTYCTGILKTATD